MFLKRSSRDGFSSSASLINANDVILPPPPLETLKSVKMFCLDTVLDMYIALRVENYRTRLYSVVFCFFFFVEYRAINFGCYYFGKFSFAYAVFEVGRKSIEKSFVRGNTCSTRETPLHSKNYTAALFVYIRIVVAQIFEHL